MLILAKKLTPRKLSIIDNKLFVGTKSYAIELSEVQIEGKKRMLTKDFLKGNPYIEMCSIIMKAITYLTILFITCNSIAQEAVVDIESVKPPKEYNNIHVQKISSDSLVINFCNLG